MADFKKEFNFVIQAQDKASKIFRKIGAQAEFLSARMSKISGKFNAHRKQLDKTFQTVKSGASNISNAAQITTAFGAASAFGIGLLTKKAVDYERQMRVVSSISGIFSDSEFVKRMGEATKIAQKLGFDSLQAGQGLEYLALAGIKGHKAMRQLPMLMKLSRAGSLSLAEASNIATDAVSALQNAFYDNSGNPLKITDAEKLKKISDLMAVTSSEMNTNIQELFDAIKYGVSNANMLQVPIEQIMTGLGLMADVGKKGSIGGTAFNAFYRAFVDPKRRRVLASAIGREDIPISIIKDLPRLISVIDRGLSRYDTLLKAEIVNEVFGEEGARGFDALIQSGVKKITSKLDTVIKTNKGAVDRISQERMKGFQGDLTFSMSKLSDAAKNIGQLFTFKSTGGALLTRFNTFLDKMIQSGGLFAGKANVDQSINDLDIREGKVLASGILSSEEKRKEIASINKERMELYALRTQLENERKKIFIDDPQVKNLFDFAHGFFQGIKEGVQVLKDVYDSTVKFLGFDTKSAKEIGRTIGKFLVVATTMVPIFAGISIFFLMISAISSGLLGIGKIILGLGRGLLLLKNVGKDILGVFKEMKIFKRLKVGILLSLRKGILGTLINGLKTALPWVITLFGPGKFLKLGGLFTKLPGLIKAILPHLGKLKNIVIFLWKAISIWFHKNLKMILLVAATHIDKIAVALSRVKDLFKDVYDEVKDFFVGDDKAVMEQSKNINLNNFHDYVTQRQSPIKVMMDFKNVPNGVEIIKEGDNNFLDMNFGPSMAWR